MDKFELNKIIGAFLLSALALIVINNLADAVVSPEPLTKNVYVVAGPNDESAGATQAAMEPATEPSEASEPATTEMAPAVAAATGEEAGAAMAAGTPPATAADVTQETMAATPTAADGTQEAMAEATEATPPTFAAEVAAASPAAGAKLFRKCASCHTKNKGGKRRVGPNLWNIVGAPVAAKDGFNYSSALANHGGVWDEETLDRWLTSPRGTVPGTKMTFAGLKNEADRANLIAYLKTLHD